MKNYIKIAFSLIMVLFLVSAFSAQAFYYRPITSKPIIHRPPPKPIQQIPHNCKVRPCY